MDDSFYEVEVVTTYIVQAKKEFPKEIIENFPFRAKRVLSEKEKI